MVCQCECELRECEREVQERMQYVLPLAMSEDFQIGTYQSLGLETIERLCETAVDQLWLVN